jgi:hypothetical protein
MKPPQAAPVPGGFADGGTGAAFESYASERYAFEAEVYY